MKHQNTTALVFWIIGWLTDALDGAWADITNRQSDSGKILDPVFDRLYALAVIIATLVAYHSSSLISLSLILFLFIELVLPGLYLAVKLKHHQSIVPPHNAYGKFKACSIGFALPLVWFGRPETGWQIALGGLIVLALVFSLANVIKNIAFGRFIVKSPG